MANTTIMVPAQEPEAVQLAVAEAQQLMIEHNYERMATVAKALEEAGVHSDGQMEEANEILGVIVEGYTAQEKYWEKRVPPFHAIWKMMTNWRGEYLDKWSALRTTVERPMKEWRREQKEMAARRQAEIDKAAEQLRKQKEAEARKLMAEGQVAAAKELKLEAKAIVAPVIQVEVPKLQGNTEKEPWLIQVNDAMALVQAIASGKVSIEVIKAFNEGWLKKRATEVNDVETFQQMYPGVRAWQDISFAVSRK
jgi:hypothetical protein